MAKISNVMATKVALDLVDASKSVRNLTTEVNASTKAWQAQEASLRSAGDYAGATKARLDGLGSAIDAQKEKISALQEKQESMNNISQETAEEFLRLKERIEQLRDEQASLDDVTGRNKDKYESLGAEISRLESQQSQLNAGTVKQAETYLRYGAQVDQAKAKLASMEAQQQRAEQQLELQNSGVLKLNASMRAQSALFMAHADRLQAEGQQYQAMGVQVNGLENKINQLRGIQQREMQMLESTRQRMGESSQEYLKQATRVEELGTQIAQTRSKINELNEAMKATPHTWLDGMSARLDGLQGKADRVSHSFGSMFLANTAANVFSGALATIRARFTELIDSGLQYDVTQEKMLATWDTLTGSAGKAKGMVNTVNDLSVKTGQAVDTVDELEQGFYHLNSSKSQADGLTSSMLNMADAVGLNSQQIGDVSQDMVHAMATGKVTQGELNQIGAYFPMIDKALAKHYHTSVAGMRQIASAGKLDADTFQQVFEQLGNGKYKDAAENMMGTFFGMERTIKARMPALIGDVVEPFKTMSNPLLESVSKWVSDKRTEKLFTQFGQHLMQAFNQITTAFGGKKINVSDALTGGMEAATRAVDRFAKVVSSHHTQIKEFFDSFKTGSAASLKIFANVMLDLSKVMLPVLDELAKYPKTTAAVITSLLLASKAVKGLSVAVKGLQIMRTVGSTIGSFATKIKNIPSRKITRIQVDGAKSTRDLEAYSRRLDRIPKSKTTKAIVNTASAETSLTRLGTKATAAGKLGSSGLSLIGRGAKIASAGLDLVGGPAGGIMLIVQALTVVYQHDKKFRKFVNGLASSAKSAMGKMGKAFESGAKSAISWTSNMWDRVKKSYQQGQAQTQQQTLQHARQQQKAWNDIRSNVTNTAQDMMHKAGNAFSNGYNDVINNTSNWRNNASNLWHDASNKILNTAGDLRSNSTNILSKMHDKLSGIQDTGLGHMLGGWKDHFGKVINTIESNGSPLHNAFRDILNGLLSPFTNLINGIIKGINWVLDKVGGDSHKLGTFSIGKLANGTPGGGLLHDQVALLNDGSGPNFQEMVHFPSGETVMLPPERNLMMFLPAQTEVLDGERSAQLAPMMDINHYANGAVGDFFSGLWDKGKDVLDFAEDILKKPIDFMESVFNRFTSGKSDNGGFFSAQLHTSLPMFFAKSMADWVKKQFQEMADPAGSGVDRWRPYVVRALDMLHLSSSLVGRVLKQIQTESGGNPKALGGDDGLSDGRAMGLMQVKPPTFAAYKLPGHGNIWNGFDNLLAGLNYARHRYGDSLSFLGQGHGYANGGVATQPSIFGEAGAEMAIPLDSMKSSRAWELMRQVVAYYGSNNASQTTTIDTQNMSRQIQELIEVGKAVLAVNGEQVRAIKGINGYDKARVYHQQRTDMDLANFQSFV
ncbi:transglycosylase SLT domain-containing protein [Limosilactobacillus fermentum]|uniref:tape measure protein n=1 Tax=Limosilactobacillus fermentum TaxID=1613 RepID=UPI0013C53E4B|nr:tape measure protein [Limosilactobacillus fermentum]QID95037.1 transglycosylase SLT domain-containing protein [Limosilactobacillus fermentum]